MDTEATRQAHNKNLTIGVTGAAVLVAAFGYWTLHARPPSDLRDLAFAAGKEIPGDAVTLRLRHETAGNLHLPSGRIAIIDPPTGEFYTLDTQVEPGSYPVLLTVAEAWQPDEMAQDTGEQQDEHLAFATVRFRDETPSQWMPATVTGATSGAIPLTGDSPALADAGCEASYANKDEERFWTQVLTQYTDTLAYQWTSALASLDDVNGCTVLFLYTASTPATPYVGLDTHGDPVCLTLDFSLLPEP